MKTPLFALFLLAAVPAFATTYDVSGREGSEGSFDGGNGANARSAGSIDVTIGFVAGSGEKQVFVKGVTHSARGTEQINDVYPTSRMPELDFAANGGKGGDGAEGRAGRDGSEGRDGESGSGYGFSLNGKDGSDGSDGSSGSAGGNGGAGGDGGTIRIRLNDDSLLLAPYISMQAEAGRGGAAGDGGRAGHGGRGGIGGSAGCDYTNSSMDPTKSYNPTYQVTKCGSSGSSGRSGSDGDRGSDGSRGFSGDAGSTHFTTSSGQTIRGTYALEVIDYGHKETVEDGIFEPGERITIDTVTVRNSGDANVPPAAYTLSLPDGSLTTSDKQNALMPGQSVTLKLKSSVVVTADLLGEGLPVQLYLNLLPAPLNALPRLSVSTPVTIERITNPVLTTKKRAGAIKIMIANNSNKSYGASGELRRSVKVIVRASGTPNVTASRGAQIVDLRKDYVLEVPMINSHSRQILQIPIALVGGSAIGSQTQFHVKMLIDGVNEQSLDGTVALTLDRTTGFTFQQTLPHLTCNFTERWIKNRSITKLYITKPAGASKATVHFDAYMSWMHTPPTYTLTVDELGGVINTIMARQRLTNAQVESFFNTVIAPRSNGITDYDSLTEVGSAQPDFWKMGPTCKAK